jgi:hypothetical protein
MPCAGPFYGRPSHAWWARIIAGVDGFQCSGENYSAEIRKGIDRLRTGKRDVLQTPRLNLVGWTVTQTRPALFRGRHFEDVIIVLCVRYGSRLNTTSVEHSLMRTGWQR